MPASWKLREISKYYDDIKSLCFYDKLTLQGGDRHVDDLLSVLPEQYADAVRNRACFEVYRNYIAYLAEITYNDREPFDLDFYVKLLKDPVSVRFRDKYGGFSKKAVCLAVTFFRFCKNHIKYDLYGKTRAYEVAAHGMYLSSLLMLNLLGLHYDIADEQNFLSNLMREGNS